jgi:hypothetical protein
MIEGAEHITHSTLAHQLYTPPDEIQPLPLTYQKSATGTKHPILDKIKIRLSLNEYKMNFK